MCCVALSNCICGDLLSSKKRVMQYPCILYCTAHPNYKRMSPIPTNVKCLSWISNFTKIHMKIHVWSLHKSQILRTEYNQWWFCTKYHNLDNSYFLTWFFTSFLKSYCYSFKYFTYDMWFLLLTIQLIVS